MVKAEDWDLIAGCIFAQTILWSRVFVWLAPGGIDRSAGNDFEVRSLAE